MAISKIGSRAIIDGSVLAADFAPGTVTGAKLAGSIGNDKLANSAITLGGEAISLGGTDAALNLIDWQSKVTSDGSTVTTMVAGRGYFVDNSSAAGLVKLPASATIGQQVAIKDYAGNFATNNLTIQRNSHKIQGNTNDATIKTNRASIVLVYVDSTKGWLFDVESNISDLQTQSYTSATGGTVTTSGNDKIHTFTGDGNFVVSSVGNSVGGGAKVSYVIVGGGGSGAGAGGAGGGAGGFREGIDSPNSSYTTSPLKNPAGHTITAQTYPITVGGGATGGNTHPTPNYRGYAGSNSVFAGITGAGGGAGAKQGDAQPNAVADGGAGGSGGGAGQNSGPPPRAVVGAGNTPPVSPSQGNPGGQGNYAGNTPGSGGGGGATAAGGSSSGGGNAGAGGAGATTHITGSPVGYAGGGGGTACAIHGQPSPVGGAGGSGGGGAARNGGNGAGTAGTTNRGGGGGAGGSPGFCGGSSNAGGAGGSGIVIIRYKYQTG